MLTFPGSRKRIHDIFTHTIRILDRKDRNKCVLEIHLLQINPASENLVLKLLKIEPVSNS